MPDNNKNECLTAYCYCGCERGVAIRVFRDIDTADCELSLVSDTYHIKQESCLNRFKEKCKRIWKILRNEEYEYFNIYIEADDMKEFKDFVAKI